jgi:hypothetical protein
MTKFGVPAAAGKLHWEWGTGRGVEPLIYAAWTLIFDEGAEDAEVYRANCGKELGKAIERCV